MDTFSERLEQAIQASGRAKSDIADSVGVKPPALSRWLRGSQPEHRHLAAIAKELNVDVNWLISGVNPPPKTTFKGTPRGKLKEARIKAGFSVSAFAKQVGYTTAVYQEIEDGRSGMGEKMAIKAAKILGLSVEDLMDGSDHPPSRDIPIGTFGAVPDIKLPPDIKAKYVPLISMAQCGAMHAYTDELYSHEGFIAFNITDPKAFAVRLAGDSMTPRIEPGDVAVVSPSQPPRSGGVVIAKLNAEHGEDVMLKIYSASGDLVTLSSYNPAHPPMTYPRSAFQWIYPVTQVTRSL